jgi:hypothetical protein
LLKKWASVGHFFTDGGKRFEREVTRPYAIVQAGLRQPKLARWLRPVVPINPAPWQKHLKKSPNLKVKEFKTKRIGFLEEGLIAVMSSTDKIEIWLTKIGAKSDCRCRSC